MRALLAALVVLFSSIVVTSQTIPESLIVPRLIRFNGAVRDASGAVGITFSLHKSQEDNSPLWIETQTVPLDPAGGYTVLLGSTRGEGIPMELFASGEARWLAIQVEGQREQPRVLIVSVPYALKAAEADTLAGHAATEFVTSDKLSDAVKQELQRPQMSSATKASTTPGLKSNAVTTNTATNFTDATTNQVVLVTQMGTGSGLAATSGNIAVKGTGGAVGVLGTTTSTTGLGVQGTNNSPSGTGSGVRGSAASPQGYGVWGSNSATTGASVGVVGTAASTSGVGVRGSAVATTGATQGVQALVASPTGIAGVFRNTSTGKILSGQAGSTHREVFSVDNAGAVSGSSFNIGPYQFAYGSVATGEAYLGFAGSGQFGLTTVNGFNTAVGYLALRGGDHPEGGSNTAVGYKALFANGASKNTAVGSSALSLNINGASNTAVGANALQQNVIGTENSAFGYGSLSQNTASYNTAVGAEAMSANTTGTNNVAVGYQTLNANTEGVFDTALGYQALLKNTTGASNTAVGNYALRGNTTGYGNTAVGDSASPYDAGNYNTSIGWYALSNLTAGSDNIALGWEAGGLLTSGSENIYIGNNGVASESNTIRIGNDYAGGYTAFYVGGVAYTNLDSGSPVYISGHGQLGVLSSSIRYKDDVEDIGDDSRALLQLRPVKFRYKKPDSDGSKPLQFGLIAEEVAKVLPEAVSYNEKGEPESVAYHKINAMLLNEVQRQQHEIDAQNAKIELLQETVQDLKKSLSRSQ